MNVTPVERLGRMAVGLAAVVAGIVMLSGAGSAPARRGGRYTLARQGLLALRDQPRRWSLPLPVTLAGAVIALIADILIAAAR